MKNQPEDKFEQRIRERLQSLESDPPAGAWDRLAADLPVAASGGYRRWAALIVLLGVVIGGVIWWATTDSRSVSEEIDAKSASGDAQVSSPIASDTTLAGSNKPYNPTNLPESATRSAISSQPAKHESATNHDQTTARSTSIARVSGDTSHRMERNPPRGGKELFPRSSSNQAMADLVAVPKETTRRSDNNADGRALVPAIASSLPIIVAQLPEVALVFPPSRLVSEPSLSLEPVPVANRWELWVNANPLLLYQRVAPDPSDEIQVTSLNRTTFSQDRLGLQASGGGLYRLTPRLALKFGVYYRYTQDEWTYNYHKNVTDTFRVVRVDANTVEAAPVYEEQLGTVREVRHDIGALAGVQYRLSSRWLGNILAAELQAQSLADNPAWYAHVSYVAERKLNDRWSVYGGPSFLWNFSGSRIQSDHLTLKPYGFGAQVGVGYRLQFRK